MLYISDADFRDDEDLQKTGAGEELAESVNFLLRNPSCNVRRQNKLKNPSHDLFGPNEMEDFRDLAKKMTRPGGHGHVSCFVLPFSTFRQTLETLTENKEVSNDEEGEDVEIKGEEVFELDRTPLFHTRAPV